MLKDVIGEYEIRKLYEMQQSLKGEPTYYFTLGKIIKEIEKPKRYNVCIEFCEELRKETFNDVTKAWVRDNYLYIERYDVKIGYNMDKILAYYIGEIKDYKEEQNDTN